MNVLTKSLETFGRGYRGDQLLAVFDSQVSVAVKLYQKSRRASINKVPSDNHHNDLGIKQGFHK